MINFKSTNEVVEGYAIVLTGYTNQHGYVYEEEVFDVYSKLGYCKTALKSNKGLSNWVDRKWVNKPHRIEKIKITIEKLEDIE